MRRCKGVLLAGMLVLSMSVPVYADKSVVVKVEAPADTTDYYMTVDSGGVGVDIYPSTDEKGEKLNDKTVKDGTVLHIEGETEKNGETWGYTEYNGRYGYVPLEELRPSRDAELVKAGIAGSTEKETSGVKQGGTSDTQNFSAGETQGEAAGTDSTGSAQAQNGEIFGFFCFVLFFGFFYRPFCKWICPLGAFYALMNKVSLLGIKVDEHKCVSCGKCARACKMDVDVIKTPNSTECIRCGKCITACPTDALSFHYGFGMPEKNLCNTVKENNKTDMKTNNKKDITTEE